MMHTLLTKLVRNEEGAAAIEYGLIAALIAVALVAGGNSMREGVTNLWQNGIIKIVDAHLPTF